MKRRDFLKKLGIVCGAVVACPAELLKPKLTTPGIDCNKPFPWKHVYFNGQKMVYRTVLYDESALVTEFEKEFWNTKFKSPIMDQFIT